MKYEDEIMQPLTLCDPTYIRAHLVQPGISKSVSIFVAFPAPSSSEPDKLPEIVLGTTTFNQSTSSSTISRYSENEKTISRNTSEEGDHIVKSPNEKGPSAVERRGVFIPFAAKYQSLSQGLSIPLNLGQIERELGGFITELICVIVGRHTMMLNWCLQVVKKRMSYAWRARQGWNSPNHRDSPGYPDYTLP
ncbi:hypothetical protein I307_06532 [Cryptococcus deuterogattii 99/473]|uniref:Uncharacterized protein n=1 Tax=Cryptococcus deuterogattii Ram5 TaxID=1296110 RepID=A0A0D0TYB1_9TREE|nr:hypothetical protein I313_03524 [Cryptococcus deuterogattii Ram5]KIY54141.1 hypothetical protein I307_06532 [Cryptococcus deuterogattii 99/473]